MSTESEMVTRLARLLGELTAIVRGESPRLLNAEDAPDFLSIDIDKALAEAYALAASPASPPTPAVDGWQPIETAPKDDTMFLAGWLDGRMCVMKGSILAAQKARTYPTPEHLQFQCSHWQPLPEPPK